MPSVRSRTRYKSRSYSPVTYKQLSTGVLALNFVNIPVKTELEAMSDRVTSNFRKKVGRSALPQNPLTYTCQTVDNEVGSVNFPQTTGPGYQWDGPLVGAFQRSDVFGSVTTPVAPSYDLAKMTAEAKFKALSRFDRPDYSFGETIAELRYTMSTVKAPLSTVASALKRFHKKRLSNPKKYAVGTKALADLWASYSFGIGPLIGSANDAVNAYIDRNIVKPTYRSVYGYSEFSSGALRSERTSSSFSGWTSIAKGTRSLDVKVKAGFWYSTTDASSKKTLVGLRARDLPGVAWELVPLSFMVDRVINVKRFVNASASLLSSNVHIGGGFVTVRVSDIMKRQYVQMRHGTVPSLKVVPSDSPLGFTRAFTLTRSPWSPIIADAIPKFENRLFSDIHSTLDVISLVLGRFKFRLK